MLFTKTTLKDAWVVDLEKRGDERGFFARTMCVDEFAAHGMDVEYLQQNVSLTVQKGTLRGMHFQKPPFAETKLIRCVKGAIADVIIDLRPDSPTYMKWEAFELSDRNYRQLYVPKDFAHGFQTLTDDAEVTYLMGGKYAPGQESGIRYDDPAFAIAWPLPVSALSDKDRAWPPFVSQAA